MKKLFIVFSLLVSFACSSALAGNLSPFAIKLSNELKAKNEEELQNIADYKISAMIMYDDTFSFIKAEELGISFPTIAGRVATAQIPLKLFNTFVLMQGVKYLEVEQIATPTLDSAQKRSHITEVKQGAGYPQKYTGEGVVIGIIDTGFDYTHPAFYDHEKGKLKISRVWDQVKTGKKPEGFDYGSEYITPEEILTVGMDIDSFSHGSHVASITAGTRVPGAEEFEGVANDAELVIVALDPPSGEQWKSTSAANMVDGVNYIFKYAESVGKPAVVNMSWGGPMGPHDGTSLFNQAIDALTGKGKIFVNSAGNSGANKVHLNKTFTPEDKKLTSYVQMKYDQKNKKNGLWIDSWGEAGKEYSYKLTVLYAANLNKPLYETPVITLKEDGEPFVYKYVNGHDTCEITITSQKKASFNDKPRILTDIYANQPFYFKVEFMGEEGRIDVWNMYIVDYYGIYTPFEKMNDKEAVDGNTDITISDLCTGVNTIAVGAYSTKTKTINTSGKVYGVGNVLGQLAYFTSHGPAVGNRIKPDISGPGHFVVAAVGAADKSFDKTSNNYRMVAREVEYNGKLYPYAAMSGTSMSSPMVAGGVALMLQLKPELTPAEVLDILQKTAIVDEHTGEVPNVLCGAGKMNIKKAFDVMLGYDCVDGCIFYDEMKIYPNPFRDVITIENSEKRNLQAEVYSTLGVKVASFEINTILNKHNMESLNSGMYSIILKEKDKVVYSGKIIKQ